MTNRLAKKRHRIYQEKQLRRDYNDLADLVAQRDPKKGNMELEAKIKVVQDEFTRRHIWNKVDRLVHIKADRVERKYKGLVDKKRKDLAETEMRGEANA